MKTLTTTITKLFFAEKIGKTAVETPEGTAFVAGNHSANKSTKVNIVINEVGDKFVATKDSANGHFKAGETVTRQAQSIEFKSFVPSVAEQFVDAAAARGMAVNFVVQG
ncbi:MAG: hypothetical protein EBS55_12905 [Flavobacteriaceae bacterium]|nr:hypothetical protein [Flavobacteriaceae bacterium]